jgi:clan AA aspartic protease (TIGR02281 family)
MVPSRASVLSVLFSLALIATGISLADSAPATPPNPPSSPENLFKARSLAHMGLFLILTGEIDVHDGVHKLRAAKSRILSDTLAQHDLDAAIKTSRNMLNDLSARLDILNNQYNQNFSHDNPYSSDNNSSLYNQWNAQQSSLNLNIKSLTQKVAAQKADLDDLLKRRSEVIVSQPAYVSLAMDIGAAADSVSAGYSTLAKDDELTAAIVQYNQTNHTHAKLGPSGVFLEDLAFIRQCTREIATGDIPVRRTEDGALFVQAVLNGKTVDEMLWDSGTSTVQLCADTAKSLGLTPTGNDPTIDLTLADGRTTKASVLTLDSIRIGTFTAKNVRCTILPLGFKTDDLLGDSFQQHFISKFDQRTGKLKLSPIDSSATKPAEDNLPPQFVGSAPGTMPSYKLELIGIMRGSTSRHDADGSIVLIGDERINTALRYSPPVKWTVVAQTDSTNLRIAYAADQIIFNWEMGQNQLRINGGPADGRNLEGMGHIPLNQWVKVELTVLPDSMKIAVDGQDRYSIDADFSHVNQNLAIFPANGSTIKVKSVTLSPPNK